MVGGLNLLLVYTVYPVIYIEMIIKHLRLWKTASDSSTRQIEYITESYILQIQRWNQNKQYSKKKNLAYL